MRPELQTVLGALPHMAPEQLPELLGELEMLKATALLRIAATAPRPVVAPARLTIEEVAKRLKRSKDYVYNHVKEYPFAYREHRNWCFSSQGLDEYLSKKDGNAALTATRQARILSLSSSR